MQKPAATKQRRRYLLGPCTVHFGAAKTGTWRVVRPVYDAENCTGCRQCEKFCPAQILTFEKAEEKGGKHNVEFDWEFCKGCGICVAFCPSKALELDRYGMPFIAHPEKCKNCHCFVCDLLCPDFAITGMRKRKSK